jgi:hypothetical protein
MSLSEMTTTRPTSAAGQLARGEQRTDAAVLAELEKQLRSDVRLGDLHGDVVALLNADASIQCPADRFRHYRRRITAASGSHPCVAKFVAGLFSEVDRFARSLEASSAVSPVEVATAAMSAAAKEAAEARVQSEASGQRVRDLEVVVRELTEANVKAAREHDKMARFVDDLRLAVSSAGLSSSVDSLAGVAPDSRESILFLDKIAALGAEVEGLRAENSRLADVAGTAIEQHTEQSHEMAELLDRANGFQTHVGHMKTTMRVMKGYIEKLEKRVFLLSDASDSAAFDRLDRHQASFSLAAADSMSSTGATVLDRGIALRGVSVPMPTPTADDVVAAARAEFAGGSGAPAQFRNLGIPNLVPRPFGGLDGVEAYLEELFAALQPADTRAGVRVFDECLWEYLERRAPAGSAKAATEVAVSLHFETKEASHRSYPCFLFQALSSGDVGLRCLDALPRHWHRLREALQTVEPTSRRQKDKISRLNFLNLLKRFLPTLSSGESVAIAQATIIAATADGAKGASDDVSYGPYFDGSTSGASLVRDVLRQCIVANAVRFGCRVAIRCVEGLRSDAFRLRKRVKQERLASLSADVRRMMKLDDTEVVTEAGVASLHEWRCALEAEDPVMPSATCMAIVQTMADAAHGKPVVDLESSVEELKLPVSEWRALFARTCFVLPASPDFPEVVSGAEDEDQRSV